MTTKKKTRRRKRAATVVEAAPAVEEVTAVEEVSAPLPAPTPVVPPLSLEEYKHVSGIRPEHFGGFARFISLEYGRNTQARKTLDDWKNTYEQYLNRPVIG